MLFGFSFPLRPTNFTQSAYELNSIHVTELYYELQYTDTRDQGSKSNYKMRIQYHISLDKHHPHINTAPMVALSKTNAALK